MNSTEGPLGRALIDFAQAVADALEGEWTVEWERNDEEHPDYWPTRVTLVNDEHEHGWHLRVNGTHPATPGRVTVFLVDRYPPEFHQAIDWDAVPSEFKAVTVSVDRSGGAAAVARDIETRVLNEDAEERRSWLRREVQRIARDQTSIDAACVRLRKLADAPYEELQAELRRAWQRPDGPLTSRVQLSTHRSDHTMQLPRRSGVELLVTGTDSVTLTVNRHTVSLRAAAMIARIISGDTHANDGR